MPPHPAGSPSGSLAAGLAGGTQGPGRLRPLLGTVLTALADGATARGGPLPAGGPEAVARRVREACTPVLPDTGTGAEEALRTLVRALAEGAADPADPRCTAHLQCPPLAAAVAADLAAGVLNPSLDSWDQAPSATALEAETTAVLAALVYPHQGPGSQGPVHHAPDALITTGGTESNQLALLLAREHAAHPPLQVVCGANAHHSIHRAAWLLGLPEPVTVDTPAGIVDPGELARTLEHLPRRSTLVVATAGTTDTGAIDPLPQIGRIAEAYGAALHIDAAYGGPLLFSDREAPKLDGLTAAASVTLDLHKLGWQPVAAGLLAVPDTAALRPLDHRADYLNAADDTEAGMPDVLGRSLRTSRRPDVLKIAVTLRALGRDGIGRLVDTVCDQAHTLADLIEQEPGLTLHRRPAISTVLFRPADATDHQVAAIRRTLLDQGRAVLGRARADGRLWLKATLLNPATRPEDLQQLLDLITSAPRTEGTTDR
ncbi:aminotransferase class V-fold PLP-dependent enzyme [Actinacidiphila oryziradicis]|uniref:pyridoxal phosphate-dependent decarboxylase family protein n=1 Tax=Actinacidiphila oryziradicis TaxID=2571141 RepID=UPI0023F15E42|nr:aminotransferase class V-fold PLP-dependent enzyme [Actinacidiphila oryziradicis]MCW2869552.1 putative amino acid decarboxylase [Actinacidiphila oryziradicis]